MQSVHLERGQVDATEAEEPAQLPGREDEVVVGHLSRKHKHTKVLFMD